MQDKNVKSSWVTFSQKVEIQKSFLVSAVIVASAAGAATADIYNGGDTSGKKICTLSAAASEMGNLNIRADILCENGIYINVGSNVTGVLILTRS